MTTGVDQELLGGRFVLEREVGSGGMGTIFQALDRETGERVALKLLHSSSRIDVARFEREAELLARLVHPAVVRYVAHGHHVDGRPYLAMEWLEGVDLAERLARRGALDVREALVVARRLADALATVHAHRLVHRDVKPGNVFLVDGEVEHAKLVDFGLARSARGGQLTSEGMVLGTPAYMAPEQVRGEATDPRIDVYGVGGVLFECLSLRAPFDAGDIVELLGKVLLEPAPRVRALRPDVPAGLSAFIARLLSKDPNERPRDGEALRAELYDLDLERPEPAHAPGPEAERQLACVLVLTHPGADEGSDAVVRALAEQFGGALAGALPQAYLVSFALRTSVEEMVVRAARCALAATSIRGFERASLATLREGEERAIGKAIERAARGVGLATAGALVSLDELSAHLLPQRFELTRAEGGAPALSGERDGFDGSLPLRGVTSSFVGREIELAWLVAETRRALEERRADVVVVSGEPGAGKSRLRREASMELSRQLPELSVWSLRGEPSEEPTAFGCLRTALARQASLSGLDPGEDHRRLLARLARHLAPERVPSVARVLGELVGLPFADPDRELEALRSSPERWLEHAARALAEWLVAEASQAPLVLALEDAQWVDTPTLRLLLGALRFCGGRTLSLWILTRPEGLARLDEELAGLAPLRLTLHPLPDATIQRLVGSLLGARANDELVRSIVERSLGNPLLAEELARGALEGWDDGSARTILGLIEARLLALPPKLVRVLRAAALVGQVVYRGAVAELCGDLDTRELDAELDELVRRDWLVDHAHARHAGDRELAFRHPVLRDAAEAALPAEARLASHRIIARWLERVGDRDEARIAAHFARAGAGHLAATHYARAANQAILAGDARAALEQAARGLSCGPDERVRGWLRVLEAEAHERRFEPDKALWAAREAERLLREIDGVPDDRHVDAQVAVVRAARHLGWLDSPGPDPKTSEGRVALGRQLLLVEARLADPAAARPTPGRAG